MNFDEIMKALREQQKQVDNIGMNYLFDEDVEVCGYVLSQLHNIDVGTINPGRIISMDELMERTLEETEIFGDDVHLRIQKLISSVPKDIIDTGDIDQFGTGVSYTNYSTSDGKNKIVVSDSGKISGYTVPKTLKELSVYHFGHEQVHGLKETNYNEYVDNMIFGETLPLFYELMIYNPNEFLKRELIKFRMKYLLINMEEYELFDWLFRTNYVNEIIASGMEKISDQTKLYEFARSKVGCYLNSFYYAMILYSMYKETPQKILDLVNKVLKHEMTTLQLLEYLNIYGDIRGEVFEKELGNVRRLVK